jgi:excisionase family DNA binding protein
VKKQENELLRPAEVSALFRVDPRTAARWAKAGKLSAIRTLGGQHRYHRTSVQALLEAGYTPAKDAA